MSELLVHEYLLLPGSPASLLWQGEWQLICIAWCGCESLLKRFLLRMAVAFGLHGGGCIGSVHMCRSLMSVM